MRACVALFRVIFIALLSYVKFVTCQFVWAFQICPHRKYFNDTEIGKLSFNEKFEYLVLGFIVIIVIFIRSIYRSGASFEPKITFSNTRLLSCMSNISKNDFFAKLVNIRINWL